MYKSPSSPSSHKKSRRKGIPCRAPARHKAGPPPGQVNTSGALLLLALLREGRKGTSFDNTRHKSVAPATGGVTGGGSGGKRATRERDTLPPPAAGYGRGKRSASATVSNVGDGHGSFLGAADGSESHPAHNTAVANSRATSTGSTAHHSLHHSPLHPHEVEHVPSPLARSFSFPKEHARSASPMMPPGVVRERESRKLDAPHHLQ